MVTASWKDNPWLVHMVAVQNEALYGNHIPRKTIVHFYRRTRCDICTWGDRVASGRLATGRLRESVCQNLIITRQAADSLSSGKEEVTAGFAQPINRGGPCAPRLIKAPTHEGQNSLPPLLWVFLFCERD